MLEFKLHGVTIRRDNPKTGEYLVRSIKDQKRLLSAIATDMLAGKSEARTLAQDIDKCRIRVDSEIFLKRIK